MENKITVIIPAYNEKKTIGKVVEFIRKNKLVDEVIVVDNGSEDNTGKIAEKSGAKVVLCTDKGKGYAMERGIKEAKNDIIVFLDADIAKYDKNVIQILTNPIIKDDVDFVKSMFERKGGRVTELVAKPLLNLCFPRMYKFSQPLSGMIAGKKEYFDKVTFEKDYGVDIGVLLDMIQVGANVKEVHIGKLTNDSKHWTKLDTMCKEVMRAILKRKGVIDDKNNFCK